MADEHVLFNATSESLVYTPDGRSVDAGAKVNGNPRSPTVKALLEREALIDLGPVSEQPAEDTAPADDAPDDAEN